MTTIRAYHFTGPFLRDGRPVPKDGEKLVFPGVPILRVQGLHASLHPSDALTYAPGPILCLVECGGTILHDVDKLVCTERTIVRRFDATELLRYFARMQAVSVIDYWLECPPDVVLDYLMTGDESIRAAAADAASSAASAATRAATWYAAWDAWAAARAAASSAARAAARDAWAAARAAAWDAWSAARAAAGAAWAAARDAARAATEDAWAAARAAAGDAARAAARDQFLSLVEESFAEKPAQIEGWSYESSGH